MLQSKLFYKTLKKPPKNIKALSHILLTRAGFIDQASVGSFSFLPLGFRVLRKIENIVREEMEAIAGQEILMPALVSKDNWQKTERWQTFDALFKLKGAGNKEYALNPTHEEIISPLAAKYVFSYKDLPFYLFQIQTKFRNELRAKSGILRTREFLMKDLYSFHASEKDLDNYYEKIGEVYSKIFKRCGIFAFRTLALGGTFSDYSHEYQAVSESGEDTIYVCQKCSFAINKEIKNKFKKCPNCKSFDFRQEKSIEVANIFKLGTKYSLPFDLKFKNKDGKEKPVVMGCYGLGLSRLMGAVVEINNDKKGIIWPEEITPFDIHLIAIGKIKKEAEKIYDDLQKNRFEVLYDDRRDISAGEKLAEADLIGISKRIIISERTLKEKSVEIKNRKEKNIRLLKIKSIKLEINNKC